MVVCVLLSRRPVPQKRAFGPSPARLMKPPVLLHSPSRQIPSVRRLDFDHHPDDFRHGAVSFGGRSDAAVGRLVREQRQSAEDSVLLLLSIRAAYLRLDRTLPPVRLPTPVARYAISRFLRRTPPDPKTERLRQTWSVVRHWPARAPPVHSAQSPRMAAQMFASLHSTALCWKQVLQLVPPGCFRLLMGHLRRHDARRPCRPDLTLRPPPQLLAAPPHPRF